VPEPREAAVRYVAQVQGSWFGPLSEKDADYLRKNAPPGSPTWYWIRQLVPPTFFPGGRGWVVLMIEDKLPVDAVGPLGTEQDAEGELEARSHDVVHGSVEPLRPREEVPGLP
jgi:hypothetical protein